MVFRGQNIELIFGESRIIDTFASAFRSFSSAGLERLLDRQEVGSSNLPRATKKTGSRKLPVFFVTCRAQAPSIILGAQPPDPSPQAAAFFEDLYPLLYFGEGAGLVPRMLFWSQLFAPYASCKR